MSLGEKISALRKGKSMTQAELGETLGVTYQAVSKWERDESLPDFEMISRLAKLFGVSITYFESDVNGGDNIDKETAETVALKSEAAHDEPFGDNVLGVCTVCGKIVKEGDEVVGATKLICKNCDAERVKAEKAREEEIKRRQSYEASALKGRYRRRAIIAAVVAGIISLAIMITSFVFKDSIVKSLSLTDAMFVPMVIIGFILRFSWIFQLFFDGVVREVTCWGFAAIKLPGIIFSADLDGLIFLIVMKILLFILSGIISLLLIFLTSFMAMIAGVFTFVPVTIKIAHPSNDDLLD